VTKTNKKLRIENITPIALKFVEINRFIFGLTRQETYV
jgi:hypothetical protein